MDFPRLLWCALVAVEVAAVGLAWRAAAQKADGSGALCGVPEPSSPVEPTRTPKRTSVAIAGSRKMLRVLAFVKRSPLLVLLVFALVDELVVEALHVFAFAGAPRPLAGWARLGWHVETAFVLGWPAALAAACWRASEAPPPRGREPPIFLVPVRVALWTLAGCYLGLFLALVAVYPLPRARLRWTFLAWEVACVALAWAGLYRARLRPWGAVERCLVILAACETMVALVGPFASDPFTRWWVGACFYLAAWSVVVVVLGRVK